MLKLEAESPVNEHRDPQAEWSLASGRPADLRTGKRGPSTAQFRSSPGNRPNVDRVVAVLNPHGPNEQVLEAAVRRAGPLMLSIDLVVLGELTTSLAPAVAALDQARQQVRARLPGGTVYAHLGNANIAGWADELGGRAAEVFVADSVVHGLFPPTTRQEGPHVSTVRQMT